MPSESLHNRLKYTPSSNNNIVSVAVAITTAEMLSLMEPRRGWVTQYINTIYCISFGEPKMSSILLLIFFMVFHEYFRINIDKSEILSLFLNVPI